MMCLCASLFLWGGVYAVNAQESLAEWEDDLDTAEKDLAALPRVGDVSIEVYKIGLENAIQRDKENIQALED